MKIKMAVTFNDGVVKDITATFADFVGFERTWNRSVTKFETELRLTDLAWLAWHAEKRHNPQIKPFDPDWVGTIDEVNINNDVAVEGETPLAKEAHTG
ncbi:hypothetical protein UFOVP519_4 [uncultured Caudovirales phage]|jgi:hypothetical protein|uniref:Uncharacterized protein n=1 Tax=uncultured Caudovirales phage TaxID=2100421 RepID=A0A6J5MKZ1_9CAUD|nr:hypothetical protein UFOVP519_4 [uncultured Caudovirales phage]